MKSQFPDMSIIIKPPWSWLPATVWHIPHRVDKCHLLSEKRAICIRLWTLLIKGRCPSVLGWLPAQFGQLKWNWYTLSIDPFSTKKHSTVYGWKKKASNRLNSFLAIFSVGCLSSECRLFLHGKTSACTVRSGLFGVHSESFWGRSEPKRAGSMPAASPRQQASPNWPPDWRDLYLWTSLASAHGQLYSSRIQIAFKQGNQQLKNALQNDFYINHNRYDMKYLFQYLFCTKPRALYE